MNGHVGEGNNVVEETIGKLEFAKRSELAISNTFFEKKLEHEITYCNGGRNTQIYHILVRRRRLKEVVKTKVIVGESVAKQHRMVNSKTVLWTKWKVEIKPAKRIKSWKMKCPEHRSSFQTLAILDMDGKEEVVIKNGL